jgi:hypothetical protein
MNREPRSSRIGWRRTFSDKGGHDGDRKKLPDVSFDLDSST